MKEFLFLFTTTVIVLQISAEQKIAKSIFPQLPVAVQHSENFQCQEQSDFYQESLSNFSLWAHEMWDSSAKSFSGILRGSSFQLGHYEQCITANAPFLTKFCVPVITATVPEPAVYRDPLSLYHHPNEHILHRLYPYKDKSQQARNIVQIGWCIPASCSVEDMERFLNTYVNETTEQALFYPNLTYSVKVPEITCTTKEYNKSFKIEDICFCILTLVLVSLVILSTIYDIATGKDSKSNRKSFCHRYLVTFSARKSIRDLQKRDESNKALSALYGIRSICIFFIILDHRFGTFTSSPLLNFNYVEEQYRAPLAPFIFHGDLFVNTFFIMGGLLVAFGLLNHLDKRSINPIFIIISRYIRLTPAYAFVVFYYATIYKYTGSGPFWNAIGGQESRDCIDNWWTNLLYINNYVHADHMCMAHSWYLPCDFHFFIISIGVCFLLHKNKKFGLFILLILTVISIIIPFIITLIYERPALLHFYPDFLTSPKNHVDYLLTYVKSHTRATSYFIGIFMGYLYYKERGQQKHIRKIQSLFLWIMAIFFIIVALLGGAVFYNPYHKYNAFESAIYAALHRPAFDVGTVLIIYLCSYGHTGFVKKVLNWYIWIPLGKLVYCAYLVHMQFQLRYAGIFMTPRYFSYFDVICLALADIVLSFLVAGFLFLLIEAPFKNLYKEILMPGRTKTENDSTDEPNGSCESDSKL